MDGKFQTNSNFLSVNLCRLEVCSIWVMRLIYAVITSECNHNKIPRDQTVFCASKAMSRSRSQSNIASNILRALLNFSREFIGFDFTSLINTNYFLLRHVFRFWDSLISIVVQVESLQIVTQK